MSFLHFRVVNYVPDNFPLQHINNICTENHPGGSIVHLVQLFIIN